MILEMLEKQNCKTLVPTGKFLFLPLTAWFPEPVDLPDEILWWMSSKLDATRVDIDDAIVLSRWLKKEGIRCRTVEW